MFSLYLFLACAVTAYGSGLNSSCSCAPKIPALTYPTCASSTLDGTIWFLQLLGFGSASSVLKARSGPRPSQCLERGPASPDNEVVAVKVFDRQSDDEAEDIYVETIRQEANLLMKLGHPNVVGGYELLHEQDRFLAVIEYCASSLDLNTHEQWSTAEEQDRVLGSLFMALHYLHEKGIAHRDVKLENVLLCKNDTVKLGDFGSAVIFRDDFGHTWLTEDVEGTEVYLAPEALADPLVPYRADVADVWQLGILCVAVLLHRLPWDMASMMDPAFQAFENNPDTLLEKIPSRARTIIGRMLMLHPDERVSVHEAWDDEWVQSAMSLALGQ